MMSTATTEIGQLGEPGAPVVITSPAALRRWSERCRAAGIDVGLVPTMGALHAGHLSLINRAAAECGRVVVSIFVNPRQFGPGEDIDRYPRPLDEDLALLRRERIHAVFLPSVAEMYPTTAATSVSVDETLTGSLEGSFRPGHFDGVALVVAKLLNAARPERAYFGQKDAQQCAVVRRLASDLDTGTDIVVCPVVRDGDGLALSSRNRYLSDAERRRAAALPRGLARAVLAHSEGERRAATLCGLVRAEMEAAGFSVDYVSAVDGETLAPVDAAGPGCQILVAGRMGGTRLIDVIRLGIDEPPVPVEAFGSGVPGVIGGQGRD